MAAIRDDREQELRRSAGGEVGGTPGEVQGGEDRSRPSPDEPGQAAGEEETFDERRQSIMGDEYADPGTARTPEPLRPE